jgi:predicted RNA-binding protein
VVIFRLEKDGVVVTRVLDEAMDLPGRVSEQPG